MICEHYGRDIDNTRYCPYCGHERSSYSTEISESTADDTTVDTESNSKPNGRKASLSCGQKLLIANGIACVALVVFIGVGVATAVHWTKVDVPEHPETFHQETKDTGTWYVTMDYEPVCYVGENWNECINKYVNEYNNACANRELSPAPSSNSWDYLLQQYTLERARFNPNRKHAFTEVDVGYSHSQSLCNRYSSMIDNMKSQDYGPNGYVASLGDWEHLKAQKQYRKVQVSNNDYSPAVTHEATCYFGRFGECDFENALETQDENDKSE